MRFCWSHTYDTDKAVVDCMKEYKNQLALLVHAHVISGDNATPMTLRENVARTVMIIMQTWCKIVLHVAAAYLQPRP